MQTLCTAIKKNKQHHKCANTGGEHRYDFTTIEKKRGTCKELFLNLKETVSTLTATCEQIHNDRKNHVEAIRHKRNKQKFDKEYEFYTATQSDEHREMVKQYLHNVQEQIFGEENMPSVEVKEEIHKTSKIQRLNQEVDKWENMLTKLLSLPSLINEVASKRSMNLNAWQYLTIAMRKQSKKIKKTIFQIKGEEWNNAKLYYIRIGKIGKIANMINPKPRSPHTANKTYPKKGGEPIRHAKTSMEIREATLETHIPWTHNPPGNVNCHFISTTSDEAGVNGAIIDHTKPFDTASQTAYLGKHLKDCLNNNITEKVKNAHQRLPKLFERTKDETTLIYPFKYDCITGQFLHQELEIYLRQDIAKKMAKLVQQDGPLALWADFHKYSRTPTY